MLDAFAAANLRPPNVRDNTDGNCGEDEGGLACAQWMTSDILSLIVWDTSSDAQAWADGPLPSVRVGETTTVHFQEGGTTPAYDRAAYERVLEGL